MAKKGPTVEWEMLRVALTRLRKDELVEVLRMAFETLPQARITEVFGDHIDLEAIAGSPGRSMSADRLLQTVRAFHRDNLKGKYYEGFNVNSKNYMEKSEGTRQWIREINKLFEQCVAVGGKGHHRQVREGMDLLFDLLHRVDDGEDFVFFADEQGSWQVGVEYEKIFPAYFAALAATVEPTDYADRVLELIGMFESYNRDRHLRSARKVASLDQKRALKQKPGKGRHK
jgi:hypothetical protein